MTRATYLSVTEMFNLNHACKAIRTAFGETPYLVGSVLQRPDYRDVDLRLVLDDEEFQRLTAGNPVRRDLLNVAISEWLTARTGLPVDLQFQARTSANKQFDGPRNAMGFSVKSSKFPLPEREGGAG